MAKSIIPALSGFSQKFVTMTESSTTNRHLSVNSPQASLQFRSGSSEMLSFVLVYFVIFWLCRYSGGHMSQISVTHLSVNPTLFGKIDF